MGTATPVDATPDYAAITARQQKVWSAGDYAAIAARIPIISEVLCDAADLRAGSRVLDVAGGTGNTALAAARNGCRVVSLDYVPALLDRARERAAAEGLELELVEGDAQALPFPDASFDAVVSVVGVMFAPDQRRVADEMLRVSRPGGTIALASWTPEGFIGGLFRTVGAHVPPPAGLAPPPLWGDEDHVRALLGDGVSELRARRRVYTFRFDAPERFTEFFREHYGPTVAAFAALEPAGREALAADITALARRFDRLGGDGPVAIEAEYLEVVAVRGEV
ncbi:MAG TPA: class I SAM-dependent methyltransferase [Miltoncostaeaceae bacterium]|nr:class I SAM-dependent methyltransferase [Miltoncostaeaceae bacterium]